MEGNNPQTTRVPAAKSDRWWERAVIYQIYPRSFQDSNADGVGDLEGIRRRLDYIASLGVDAIWLSPIYPSPMADFGYDVADHCDVDPMFGSLASFDKLLDDVHAHGLKLLLDFVPNHTSDQHPWFHESRSSRSNPKRDWYIWRDPAPDGGPPNNWTSDMGGSAWEWDAATGQYYLHAFLREQPDLNWRNPDVRQAMLDVLHFWLDRGVDGFRIDVLWHCYKAAELPDNPPNPDYRPELGEKHKVLQHYSADQPEIHELAAAFRTMADSYGERLLVGEVCLPLPRLMAYYGSEAAPGVHLPFNFALLDCPWNPRALAEIITTYEAALPPAGWPNWVIGSHDAPRIAARIGEAQARVAMMLLLTLRGTPTLYQGDELGIGKVPIPAHRVRDPQDLRQPGLGLGRDRSRTPMPWNSAPFAGFSSTEPWLPLNPDWGSRNVSAQAADPGSMLALTRKLLHFRRLSDALTRGAFSLLHADEAVLAYERTFADERLVVVLNLSALPRPHPVRGVALVSTRGLPADPVTLRPHEGVILLPED
ncbi:alpha-amylase family glycosyl hydrolase [Novosphingobium cyanobacteriorum]|uniref:Alpha-amylase family glycosyl hydrolase n=1 Tax=Novosphingobium cyanobacteriorum TaxID=3024215 RepID=A0ABT6CIU0_9SPHN|nr:alpha-amylase family glycosyl hydrolase [Novosphingobium cyanobacteriorum]MDF8333830.1 alpha-amylase family glycosyl hydrolase [Novosphingobium cyanobacteriorum]